MLEKEIIKVDADTKTKCCDHDKDSLGHLSKYFTFNINKINYLQVLLKNQKKRNKLNV